MGSQPGIVLYRDNYQNVRNVLTQEQKGDLLDALIDGAYQGDDQLVRMAYNIFDAAIQRTNEKYQEIREKNRENARKRWEKIKEKADAYDRIRSDTSASEPMRDDASQTKTETQAQAQAETHDRKKRNIFIPPTVDEVKAYCQERGNTIDAEAFVDYYEARGWELKPGQKMKDWRASVRTWESHQRGWNGELRGAGNGDRVRGQRDLYGL